MICTNISEHILAIDDFNNPGKQSGFLKYPHSTNDSGWGAILQPITVVNNGTGPTLLLIAGNHGDEYEGQIALKKLSRTLQPEQIQGRVIIVPALNYPAAKAGTRLSPTDNLNMNRIFPGNPRGSISQVIAHRISSELAPLADAVMDLHSGGNSMIFAPCMLVNPLTDPDHQARTWQAAEAFAAPFTLMIADLDSDGMIDSVVESTGKLFLCTELGGGGMVSPNSIAIAERGIQRLMAHLNIVAALEEVPPKTRRLAIPDNGTVFAPGDGLYEVLVETGKPVTKDQPVGVIHNLDSHNDDEQVIRSPTEGILLTRAAKGIIKRGDTLAVFGVDYSR